MLYSLAVASSLGIVLNLLLVMSAKFVIRRKWSREDRLRADQLADILGEVTSLRWKLNRESREKRVMTLALDYSMRAPEKGSGLRVIDRLEHLAGSADARQVVERARDVICERFDREGIPGVS